MTTKTIAALLFLVLWGSELFAQKYLIVDRFGTNRKRLAIGEDIRFKQKEIDVKYNDYIAGLDDSTVYLGEANIALKINEFDAFYFRRPFMDFLNAGTGFVGGGFLFAAAVEPLVSDSRYDARESAIIGASFMTVAVITRFLRWKKIKIGKRGRVRVVDVTFRK